MSEPHLFGLRVYFEDTDAGGIVYHASYLRFAERARTEYLRANTIDHMRLRERFGGYFVVVRCDVRYRRPGHVDDWLVVASRVLNIGAARLQLAQRVMRDELELACLQVDLAFVDPGGRALRLPAPIRALPN